jgi:hypothetical protein
MSGIFCLDCRSLKDALFLVATPLTQHLGDPLQHFGMLIWIPFEIPFASSVNLADVVDGIIRAGRLTR